MTIDEMISVLQAVKAGKKIQSKPRVSWDAARGWEDVVMANSGMWIPQFSGNDYRIKPEPREFVIILDENNNVAGVGRHAPGASIGFIGSMPMVQNIIKVREVLE